MTRTLHKKMSLTEIFAFFTVDPNDILHVNGRWYCWFDGGIWQSFQKVYWEQIAELHLEVDQ